MIFAFVITLGMVIGGIFLIAIGKSTEGLASIFVPTGLQAGNFLLQRYRAFNKMKKDSEEENDNNVRSSDK